MWPNPQFPEEILNGKLHFLSNVKPYEKTKIENNKI